MDEKPKKLSAKRIIIISPAHPLRGGIAALSERLAQELQCNGAQVTIYSFSLQYPGFLFPGKTQFTDDPPPKDLKIKSIINSIYPLNWLKVGQMIRREKPDLVIIRYWLPFMAASLGTIARIIKRNKFTKIITIADNILPHEKRPGDWQLTNYLVQAVDGFIVMSKSVEADLRLFTKNKPAVFTPHPIYDNYGAIVTRSVALQYLQLPESEHYILFFGFIRKYKGFDLLLEAIADNRIKKLNIKLIIAGEYYDDPKLYEDLIIKHKLQDCVVLRTDFIPNEAVKYYFAAADLVVQPYRSATQSGISQMAYHFEKPMVVTNVGGLPEIVEHGKAGYVVEVNATAIADAIVDFYDNQRFATMQQGVREAKKRFEWSAMVEAIERVSDEVTKTL
ncbi:MAG: glycosyltransferase [Saprospiraceae bacterium]